MTEKRKTLIVADNKDYSTSLTMKEIKDNGTLFKEKSKKKEKHQTPITISEKKHEDVLNYIDEMHNRAIKLLKDNLPACLLSENTWKLVIEDKYNHDKKVNVIEHDKKFSLMQLLQCSLSNYQRKHGMEYNQHRAISSALKFISHCFYRKEHIKNIIEMNIPISFDTLFIFMKFSREFEQLFKLELEDKINNKISIEGNLNNEPAEKKKEILALYKEYSNKTCNSKKWIYEKIAVDINPKPNDKGKRGTKAFLKEVERIKKVIIRS
jgi:hypothetical protein